MNVAGDTGTTTSNGADGCHAEDLHVAVRLVTAPAAGTFLPLAGGAPGRGARLDAGETSASWFAWASAG